MADTPQGIDPSKLRPHLGLSSAAPSENLDPRPGLWITVAIILLAGIMISGGIAIWRTGAWSPTSASAAPAPTRPNAKALAASLDAARVYSRKGEWSKAEAILRQITQQYPMEQDVRIALAESLIAQKKPADAYEQYEKAIAIGPRDPKLDFAAGVSASTASLPERALEHFSMAQAGDPLAAAYPLHLGMMQRKLGQTQPAKASLLRAANLDPDNAYAWGVLADIALAENNLSIALQHIGRARHLQPDNKEWRIIEARVLKRKADPERALMLLLPMEASQRREPQIARLIAECYGMLNKHPEAAATLADASNANATDGALAYDAAVALERAGDRPKALDFAKRSQMLGNENAPKLIEKLKS
jgi:predicted Zn-dependent protease